MKIESSIGGMTFKAETTLTYASNAVANTYVEERLQETYRDFLRAAKDMVEKRPERTTFEEF